MQDDATRMRHRSDRWQGHVDAENTQIWREFNLRLQILMGNALMTWEGQSSKSQTVGIHRFSSISGGLCKKPDCDQIKPSFFSTTYAALTEPYRRLVSTIRSTSHILRIHILMQETNRLCTCIRFGLFGGMYKSSNESRAYISARNPNPRAQWSIFLRWWLLA